MALNRVNIITNIKNIKIIIFYIVMSSFNSSCQTVCDRTADIPKISKYEVTEITKLDSATQIVYSFKEKRRKYFLKDSLMEGPDSSWFLGKLDHLTHWHKGLHTGVEVNIGSEIDSIFYDRVGMIYRKSRHLPSGGHLFTINYDNGKENGDVIIYDGSGNIEVTGRYIDGKQVGKWRYYDNGKLTKVVEH